jgi:hypothetical protein
LGLDLPFEYHKIKSLYFIIVDLLIVLTRKAICGFNGAFRRKGLSVLETLDTVLLEGGRRVIVSKEEINLTTRTPNDIFVLLVEEARGSAGGRAAGSGSRRVSKIIRFSCDNGKCVNSFSTNKPEIIEQLELPYSAVAMDIKLSDGRDIVVQGLVDPELVKSYDSCLQNTK